MCDPLYLPCDTLVVSGCYAKETCPWLNCLGNLAGVESDKSNSACSKARDDDSIERFIMLKSMLDSNMFSMISLLLWDYKCLAGCLANFLCCMENLARLVRS